MKKLSVLLIAAVLVLTACGEPDDITVNKIEPGGASTIDTSRQPSSADTSSKDASVAPKPDSSSDISSDSEQSGNINIPTDVLSVVNYACEHFFPDSAEGGYEFYCDGTDSVGGYECYIVEAFNADNVFLATFALSVEYDGIYFFFEEKTEKYRVMTIGNDIVLGDYADSLVSHGVYTDSPAGYTFAYDGDPNIRTDYATTVFETPLWLFAIESEQATSAIDFSNAQVREAQEETVIREMIERLGLEFDWALESDVTSISGNSFVRRPFFATYNNTVNVEIGSVYYGYASNGRFYKIVAFSLGESNSVSPILDGISFITPDPAGVVRDDRTAGKQPSIPSGGLENGETEGSGSGYVDRPFGW